MTSRVFTEHQGIGCNADRFRCHDLVAQRIIDNAVLMNAGLVGKGVATYDCFVRLHVEANNVAEKLAGWVELRGADAGPKRQPIGAYMQRHYNLFERRISGPLADAIDGALYLTCSGFESCKAACDGQTEIVMTMHADDYIAVPDHSVAHLFYQPREFLGSRITNGVRHVEH